MNWNFRVETLENFHLHNSKLFFEIKRANAKHCSLRGIRFQQSLFKQEATKLLQRASSALFRNQQIFLVF